MTKTFVKKIQNFFFWVTIFLVFSGLIWGLWWYNHYEEIQATGRAFRENNFPLLLKRYRKLSVRDGVTDQRKLQKYFYKAHALQNSQKIQEAEVFWQHLLKYSLDKQQKSYAYFYLAKNNLDSGKTDSWVAAYLSDPLMHELSRNLYIESQLYLSQFQIRQNELDLASDLLLPILKLNIDSSLKSRIKNQIAEINIKKLNSRKIFKNSINYRIRPGDTIAKIAQSFKTTASLIKKINRLKSNVIRPNNHIKVITSQFSLIINKNKNTLTLMEHGEFFKEYPIGTGKEGSTPVGQFKITHKQKHPTWYRPDGAVIPFGSKENFLGTRWMSINYPGYGIHGTWDEKSIGHQSSEGCIRMYNADVEELFTFLPHNTKLEIVE